MNLWHKAPIVRLLFPFLLGIILSKYFNFSIAKELLFGVTIVSVISGLLLLIIGEKLSFNYRTLPGVFLFFSLLSLGYFNNFLRTETNFDNHYTQLLQPNTTIVATVVAPPQKRTRTYKIVLEVLKVKDSINFIVSNGKLLAYFEQDERSEKLKYGDEVLLQGKFYPIKNGGNPGEFDYKQYLANKNVYAQEFVRPEKWLATGKTHQNWLYATAFSMRRKMIEILKRAGIKEQNLSIVSALTLGYKNYLDKNLVSTYAQAGVTHILAVSGLHVGVIYLLMSYLLSFLKRWKWGLFLRAVLLLLLLWFYALLTGLSPSVERAATMFSFMVIAEAMNRQSNIYNTIAASALFLLVLNPSNILQLGFQLSYLAVLGIVWLQPIIVAWLHPNNWVLKKLWELCSVSIAAQLATFPLGLLYFHQFPNYFLLANLIAIPAATIILYVGMLIFFLSPFDVLIKLLGVLENGVVDVLNITIGWISSLPYAVFTAITISAIQAVLLYVILISFFVFLLQQSNRWLIIFLGSLFLFFGLEFSSNLVTVNQNRMVIYNVSKHFAVEFMDGTKSVLFADTFLVHHPEKMEYQINPTRLKYGISQSDLVCVSDSSFQNAFVKYSNGLIQFKNKTIALANNRRSKTYITHPLLKANYLIASNNTIGNIEQLKERVDYDYLIFDSSNKPWFMADVKNNTDSIYYTLENGAYEVEL